MNVLFFLLPKAKVSFLEEDDTIRQALEKMEYHHYSAIPLLSRDGKYLGTISDGDLLWYLKDHQLNYDDCESASIMDIIPYKDIKPITINNDIESLVNLITNQNFVPVIDDQNIFIGIITRKMLIDYMAKLMPNEIFKA